MTNRFPEAGNCKIAITTPIVALLEKTVGVDEFLRLLLNGKLDSAGRTYKFFCDVENPKVWQAEFLKGRSDLPQINGDVTWRKKDERWQLDVSSARIGPHHWEEQVANSVCEGILMLDVSLPEVMKTSIKGQPLSRIISSSIFDDRTKIYDIRTRSAAAPSSFSAGRKERTMLYVNCPRLEYHA